MPAVLNMAQSALNNIIKKIISNENSQLDMEFSTPALLNGLVPTSLTDERMWTNSYNVDKECRMMIDMTNNPLLIIHDN